MDRVAPLVGAWIEIVHGDCRFWFFAVAPLVGAWIEILYNGYEVYVRYCRSPRGSVD